ncbi:cytochrome b [Chitinibacter bivalviorum]|uniref:Cytochrome b n=1 Tax=Chitinibacter bivalviorum TaxID=2739434 RepID=A0A7H9BLR1_9NEIS|nr:cytochrome b [Chitinibacter bivalviorum]QLG88981.1 cytochrome b [Chitinibacter bivalviorum]
MLKNSSTRYGQVARIFHLLGVLAVVAALVLIELKGYFPKGDPLRDGLKYAHIQAGLIVLLLVWPRLLWRFGNPPPAITPTPKKETMLLAHLVHWALYGLMIALPILGIVFVQSAGKSVDFFGWVLPVLFTVPTESARDVKEIHELLGNVLMWGAILHAAAAIWHHRFVKDDTLTRMFGR